ncbi:hypothetical protein WR25_03661 [Diploscapter pachys]|uniref:Ankyrin repeat domain-containing protein n=1 Tax=Diploscapter pachys TaxID=2018661 RepID=A0A2A2KMT0_9BILA|nr:hypothetical protein WR25_03661 [Diploscapter pachys]
MSSPLEKQYPLHLTVYVRDIDKLRKILDEDHEVDLEAVDARGRTPLMLAVTLGYSDIAKLLLERGANADAMNKDMWYVSHEAISNGDVELTDTIIMYRDYQRAVKAAQSMKSNLEKIRDTPDFYCEMSWEFTSWIPYMGKLCPSDTYKIYKRGSDVRIDTTLVGFEGSSWKRGHQTFIFRLATVDDVVRPQFILLDHDAHTATLQTMHDDEPLEAFRPSSDATAFRRTTPVSTTYIDVDKIGFERSKGSFLTSWITNSEKTEKINGYECKVFNACNVSLITKTRSEHLTEADKEALKQEEGSRTLSGLLNFIRAENCDESTTANAADSLTVFEYLDPEFPIDGDIGRPKQVTRKSNTFKATLHLAENYPLNLQEQLIPIIDMMAANNAHFSRLQSFVQMQLPSGFPVKIEIPLFHVLSAKITFCNINEPGPHVTPLESGSDFKVHSVTIDDAVFEIPEDYRTLDDSNTLNVYDFHSDNSPRYPSAAQQEEMLLQLAIEQSLREQNASQLSPDAADNHPTDSLHNLYDPMMAQLAQGGYETDLERAIRESLAISGENHPSQRGNNEPVLGQAHSNRPHNAAVMDEDALLTQIMKESEREEQERIRRLEMESEEELKRVLELSLTDK